MTGSPDCKSAPLHTLGRIQAHGALIAFSTDSGVAHYCSANAEEFLGIGVDAILGKTGAQIFITCWRDIATISAPGLIIHLPADPFPMPLDVAIHTCSGYHIYEFEPNNSTTPHWWNFTRRMEFISELGNARDVPLCRDLLVRWMFTYIGSDRVMYYHLFPDRHGVVYDEACRPGVKSYLGLHFPAGDIPPNALAFYVQNYQRIIADVNSPTVTLLSHPGIDEPLDLSRSMLRSVHPVHIEYLRNMEVAASFSISIIVKNELHGLVACHHMQPLALTLSDRLAFEEIARMASIQMEHLLDLQSRDTLYHLRSQLAHIEGALSSASAEVAYSLSTQLPHIRKLFTDVGAILHYEGENHVSGDIPSEASLVKLGKWLATLPANAIYSCNALPAELAADPELSSVACGVLFLPLEHDNYLILFRPEVIQNIAWAGEPPEPESVASLSPRHSFEKFISESRGKAEEWNSLELELSSLLRAEILTYIERAKLVKISLHDALTGLPNRQQYDQNLSEALTACTERGQCFALHMLDLDMFKPVNDTYGHAAGDQLLQEVSTRLLSIVRQADTVARLGGDEFAIIQTGRIDDAGAITLAEKIIREISSPFLIEGNTISIGISVGIALCPADSTDPTILLQHADTALYAAKNNGRNQYKRFVAD